MNDDPDLTRLIFFKPTEYLPHFDDAAIWAHKVVLANVKGTEGAIKKNYIHVRIDISGSPLEFLGFKHCEGTSFQFLENSISCHDYQEIKVQESTHLLGVGAIPRSIPVIVRDDLVDTVKAGDDVIVTGILTTRWSPDLRDVRCDLDPILVANYIRRTNELKSDIDIPNDVIMKFKEFWSCFEGSPLKGRNAILSGICPQVFGLFTVKLAGVQHVAASGTKVRGESHLLLVGDPGT